LSANETLHLLPADLDHAFLKWIVGLNIRIHFCCVLIAEALATSANDSKIATGNALEGENNG
jgi:hypothetical protein